MRDPKLAAAVGGRPVTAGKKALAEVKGIRMTVYCGRKRDFGPTLGPSEDLQIPKCFLGGAL